MPWLVTFQVQGLLVQSAHPGLRHRGALGGSRHRLQALRPPLARSVPAQCFFFAHSCRLCIAMTHELMMLSRRDACALQDVVLSRRSYLPCYFFAADNAAGNARKRRVRCSFARGGSSDGAVDVSIIALANAWQPARLPHASGGVPARVVPPTREYRAAQRSSRLGQTSRGVLCNRAAA